MSYTFLKLAEDTLKKANEPLTPEEIWSKSNDYGFREKCKSDGKTPWRTIGALIYVDIKDNPNSIFCKASKRPTKFGLKSFNKHILNINAGIIETGNASFHERDLHPLLSAYVYSDPHFKCYTKTIFHEKSNNKSTKGKNKWLHPDIVGIYFPFEDYMESTIKIINSFSESALKLFSFEMKIEINISNLREYFFQAVSNSSWANEGYLVALRYTEDLELMDEMRRLNNAVGIGFIKLNSDNIEESNILVSANTRNSIDWETVNRLVEENPDFKNFIDSINEDYQVGKVKSKYDDILKGDNMKDYINKYRIIQ